MTGVQTCALPISDSLEIAELLMEFEDEFELDIPQDEDAINTVGDAIAYIEKAITEKNG